MAHHHQSLHRSHDLFAVICAGLFPLLHLGRPWVFYWLLPYPDTMALWPQFRSPLVWDVFAVSTYFTVSLLFWYMGLMPDLATCATKRRDQLETSHLRLGALGWRGSAAPLAAASIRLSAAGRTGHAAGALGA